MSRVVVSGAAGFIGSTIADLFLAAGHEVLSIDNHSGGVDWTPKGARHVGLDLAANVSPSDLEGADVVVHAAAFADLRGNWHPETGKKNRERLYRDNIQATINVLECAPKDAAVVFLSSASVYGPASGHMKPAEHEATPETIESPYAASKLAGEALVAAYSFATGRKWYVLRLVNVVGARTHQGVIADFVGKVRKHGRLHAEDDGSQKKSWVHVADVADAVYAVAYGSDAPSGLYTVTSDELVSWRDITREMGIRDEDLTWEARDRGAIGDPWNIHVASDKLERLAGFRPRRSIAGGIREALISLGWRAPS